MSKPTDNQDRPGPGDASGEASGNRLGHCQARLARDERSAALRTLAGRLAHQIRNPLAAVRAACKGLRDEVDDDQRQTIDLALREIDRMLKFVTATVQTIPADDESATETDLQHEIEEVVEIIRSSHDGNAEIDAPTLPQWRCRVPRNGFRVAIYSLLDHVMAIPGVRRVRLAGTPTPAGLTVSVDVDGVRDQDDLLATGMSMPASWVQPVGLLVAERFARDFGGRIVRQDAQGDRQTLNLELPFTHV